MNEQNQVPSDIAAIIEEKRLALLEEKRLKAEAEEERSRLQSDLEDAEEKFKKAEHHKLYGW